MAHAGFASLLTDADGPRKRVQVVAKATEQRDMLLEELGQRRKVDAIAGSYQACCSALKCYAAFCDAIGKVPHFPTTEKAITQFTAMFRSAATLEQYVKHVAWAQGFLELDDRSCLETNHQGYEEECYGSD